MSFGDSIVSGKLPADAPARPSARVQGRAAAAGAELLHHQPSASPGGVRARIGFRDDVAGELATLGVRRGAIRQAPLRSQHTVQPVRPFPAKHFDRQIHFR